MAKWSRSMKRGVPRFNSCRRSKWKDEKRLCAFTFSICSNSTAKVCSACRLNNTRDSCLKFAGKVGSGFTAKSLSILSKKLREEERDDCPFVDLPSKDGGEWVQGITPSMMKKMHWVNPKFVAQIKFAEWTRDGKLRQPVFLGMREDKEATKVRREAA